MNADFHSNSSDSAFSRVFERAWQSLRAADALRRVAVAAAVVATFSVVFSLLRPPRYASELILTPSSSGTSSRAASLASQFGIAIAPGDASRTPQFYGMLVLTDEVLARVVSSKVSGDTTVVQALMEMETDAAALVSAVQWLRDQLSVTVNLDAGTVSVRIVHENPSLAFAVVTAVLTQLNDFDSNRRQVRSTSEREYLEARVVEVALDVAMRDSAVSTFLTRNRSVSQSPTLAIQLERLQVARQQAAALLSVLEQNLQQARLDELRDTPVVTVVQAPQMPSVPLPRRLPLFALLGFAVGVTGGALREMWRSTRGPA